MIGPDDVEVVDDYYRVAGVETGIHAGFISDAGLERLLEDREQQAARVRAIIAYRGRVLDDQRARIVYEAIVRVRHGADAVDRRAWGDASKRDRDASRAAVDALGVWDAYRRNGGRS